MYVPSVATETVPCDGAVFDETVSVEPTSLDRTVVPFSTEPAATDAESLAEVGVTVRLTVAVEVCPAESVRV